MRTVLLLPFFLAFLLPGFSQTTFKRLYGTTGNDEARYVEPLGDGGFLVAGLTTAGGLGGQDAIIARISGNGAVVWSRAFGGSGIDLFSLLHACSDGNFLALGETNSFGAGGTDLYIVKFDPNGNVIWERTAGGSNQETARGIAEASDGYVITGGTQSAGAGFWDIYVEKIDFGGITQWNRTWGGGGGDIAGQPVVTGNGEIWIGGFTFISTGNHDPVLFRISAGGNLLSASHYAIPVNNGMNSLAAGGAGLVGGGGTWVGNSHFPLLINFNSSGGVVWARRYPIPGGNFGCLYAEATPDGGAIFAANEIQNDTPDAVIVKTNSNGDVDWAKAFPYESAGRLFHVRSIPGGGYVAVGYAFGSGRDWFVVKMNGEGEVQQCCPEDVSVSPVAVSPALTGFTPAQSSVAANAASPGNDASLNISFQDICTGPVCCDPLTAAIASPPSITCNSPVISLNGAGSTTGPGIAYQWSGPGIVNGGNTLQPQVNQAGVYTLVVTETGTGCTATATVTVIALSQPPVALAFAPVALTCLILEAPINGAGSSAGPGITYQWSGPGIVSGGNTLQPLVNQAGTYVLTVTNATTGCVNTASATVVQDIASPMAEAGLSAQLDCDSPIATLNGTGSSAGPGMTYQWSGPGIAGGGNTLQPVVNQAGTYILTVTNLVNGCIATDQVTVVADFAIPAVQIATPPGISCAQPQVQLDASGSSQGPGITYLWTTAGGQIIQGGNGLSPIAGAPGVYNLTIANTLNGCSNGGAVLVAGDPTAPQADAGPGGELTCLQPQIILQGSASGNNLAIQWTASPGLILPGQTALNPVAGDAGWYILIVTDSIFGCVATDTVEITEDGNVPVLSLVVSNPITCSQTSATLDGSGSSQGSPYQLSWSTTDGIFQGGTETLTAVAGMPGQYTLTVADTLNGCQISQTVTVPIDTVAPAPSIAQPGMLNCLFPEITLEGSVGGVSALDFAWSTIGGNISGNGETLQPVIDQPGLYVLEATNPQNGCSAAAEVLVEADFEAPLVDASPGGVITCADTLLTLNATATGAGPLEFFWTTPDGQILFGADTPSPQVGAAGLYQLQITDTNNGCVASAEVVVEENQIAPFAAATAPGPITCAMPEVQLDGTLSSVGPQYTYLWTANSGQLLSGAETLTPIVGQAGVYQLVVTDTVNQCTEEALVVVEDDLEIPLADAGPDLGLSCALPQAALEGQGSQGPEFSYAWTTTGGLILSGDQTLAPVVGAAGLYELVVTNTQNGCSAADQVPVTFAGDIPLAAVSTPPLLTCALSEIALDASGSEAGPGIAYSWTTSDGQILSDANTLFPIVGAQGVYTLSVTNTTTGCVGFVEVTVAADTTAPQAQAGQDAWLTCATQAVELNGQGSSQGPDYAYTWLTADGVIQSGANSLAPLAGAPGVYQLTVTDLSNGCAAADSVEVLQDIEPPIAAILPPDTLTCALSEIALDASGSEAGPGIAYSWTTSDGQILSDANTLFPIVGAPGVYTLSVTNTTTGCVGFVEVTVAADTTAPQAQAGQDAWLTCATQAVELNGQGSSQGPDYAYTWLTADGVIQSGANSLAPLAGAPGVYQLTVTDLSNGCAAADSVEVLQDIEPPIAAILPPDTLTCALSEIALDASGSEAGPGIAYYWTTSDGQILSDANTLFPIVGAPGVYTLSVTNTTSGCVGFVEVTVAADTTAPQAQAGQDAWLTCATQAVELNGQGSSQGPDYAYTWLTADGVIQSGANSLAPLAGAPGVYQLTVTDLSNGCAAADSVEVLQDIEPPIAAILPPDTLTCAHPALQLDGTGSDAGFPYLFSWSVDGGNILSGDQTLSPQVDAPGVYELLITNTLNGCSSTVAVTVFQNIQPPSADAGAGGDLTCADTLIQLSGTGVGQTLQPDFQWSTLGGNILVGEQTLDPIVDQPGVYILTVTDPANGCTASDQVEIGLDTVPPLLAIAQPGALTCTVGQVALQASGPGPGMQLLWETAGGLLLSGTETLTALAGAPGLYQLIVIDPQNGCQASVQVEVEQDIEPPLAEAGEDFVFPCDQAQVFLTGAAGSSSGQWAASWTAAGGQILAGSTGLSPLISGGGTFYLQVTDLQNGCIAADSVIVEENEPFDPEILLDQPRCEETWGQLTVAAVSGGTPPFLYSADGGATFQSNPVFESLPPGLYTVIVQDAFGCETLPEEGQILAPLPVEISLEASAELLLGNTYQINAQLNLPDSAIQAVVWTPAAGLSCTDCLRPQATPLQTTSYELEVTDVNGCTARAAIQLVVDKRAGIFVPNVFSPNGDGENDRFFIFANDGGIREIKSFLVFDRWGERVFEYYRFLPNNPAYGWDGAFQGKPLDPAVFVWFAEIEFIDGRVEVLKGDVTLVK